MRRKFLFLVADGMGGWPGELDGLTAMEAAQTPVMDAMAREGVLGVARTIPAGMPPGSDVANMALLGFDPASHHTGRGPIEAAAQGLELGENDLVWRCNLVSVSTYASDGVMLDYSSGHITTQASTPLIQRLDENCARCSDEFAPFRLIPGVQYRHLLVQRGAADSPEAKLAIRPPHDITDQSIEQDIEAYRSVPLLWSLTRCAARLLEDSSNTTKANAIWPWGQGRALTLPSFADNFGMKGAVISAVDLIKGLGRAAGMDVLEVEGATGLLDTNYEGKVAAAVDYLKNGGDMAFVHLEGPDECGHGGDATGKAEAVARFDARVVKPLREAFPDAVFLITCDHLTPVSKRTHVDDPVPFLLWGKGIEPEGQKGATGAQHFSEAQAKASGLSLDPGHHLLSWAIEKAGGL
jgi:2,3-bisphosphoglycerate-independent phosphoglycerate mutase